LKTQRKIKERLVRLRKDDRSFDTVIWRKAGTEAVFSAAWQMVLDLQEFRGSHETQPRLQRSVENIYRRSLIRTKRKAGRNQDLPDVKRLKEIR
jgi:hypothetical protein